MNIFENKKGYIDFWRVVLFSMIIIVGFYILCISLIISLNPHAFDKVYTTIDGKCYEVRSVGAKIHHTEYVLTDDSNCK